MGNGIKNAGFLDTVNDWTAIDGGSTLSVDESALGAPGRAVLTATGLAATIGFRSVAAACVAGQILEAYAGLAVSAGAETLSVEWLNADLSETIATVAIPITAAQSGPASRGLSGTFDQAWGRVVAPAGALNARLLIEASHAGGVDYTLSALKPYLAPVLNTAQRACWDPGAHDNADLQLPLWPSTLGPFLAESLPTPYPNATGFASDTNIPARADLYTQLHYEYRGRLRCQAADQDALDQFFINTRDPFFVVRQDTDQLCIADWLADGAPKAMEQRGAYVIYEVGLHLYVA